MEKNIIWVDEEDNVVGYGEKMETHRIGQLHRAFSIFVLNKNDELLLQQRALHKYHSGGLWANTCCSHPIKGEALEATIHRRLKEEMGFDTVLNPMFTFIYKADLDNDMIEHEFDHVFIGRYEDDPKPNPEEVASFEWIHIDKLDRDLRNNPDRYVYWLKAAWPEFYRRVKQL
jgi:isopentenyl-diphosphate delta-isomerase